MQNVSIAEPESFFATYEGELSEEDFDMYLRNHSVYSEKKVVDPLDNTKDNSFGLKFSDSGKIAYFEQKHHIEDIQLDTLE